MLLGEAATGLKSLRIERNDEGNRSFVWMEDMLLSSSLHSNYLYSFENDQTSKTSHRILNPDQQKKKEISP